jgi:glucokinase
MAVIALDVGGTKIAGALFSNEKEVGHRIIDSVSEKKKSEISRIIQDQINSLIEQAESCSESVKAIGACVPGIYHPEDGTVWAPNIPGWESYPLLEKIRAATNNQIPVQIESDRSCYILGEVWKGDAQGCKDAIFIAVGTGIGAGITVDGQVLRGQGGIAGAIGWMGLDRPFQPDYSKYGCFEYHASGDGLARIARKYIDEKHAYQGLLSSNPQEKITSRDVFAAYKQDDSIANRVIQEAVEYWGMAAANLISIFNPEKIIFGGGVFDAAAPLLNQIKTEAKKWAQPLAFKKVTIELTRLGSDAGLYGAAYLAQNKNAE